MEDLVSIYSFNTIGNDERGCTLGFNIPRKQSDFLFITRKANSLSGNTYHEGKNSGTNPKVFIFISGKIKLSYRKVGTKKVYVNIIDKPSIIKVIPFVIHNIEVIEDAIFLECNSITDLQNDKIFELV